MVATEKTVQLIELPLAKLQFDSYQRVLRNKWKEIAKDFNPSVAWPIVVSYRDGIYWVVDGQHRVVAAIDVGETTALCKVEYWTFQQEAINFRIFNKVRGSLLAKDAFHADLSYGEPVAVEIESIIRQEGYNLWLGYGPIPHKPIGAIGSIEKIYKTNQPEGLRRVLSVLNMAWPDEPVKDSMLNGMAIFLRRYPEISATDLAKKLQNNGATVMEIVADGALMKRAGMGSIDNCIGRAILGQYNRNKSTRRLPNLFDAQRNGTD